MLRPRVSPLLDLDKIAFLEDEEGRTEAYAIVDEKGCTIVTLTEERLKQVKGRGYSVSKAEPVQKFVKTVQKMNETLFRDAL